MLAWDTARQWQADNCITPFEEVLGRHLVSGLVHSTPSVFLLATECHWSGSEMIDQHEAASQGKKVNAWFVELAASGEPSTLDPRPSTAPIRQFMRVATRSHQFVLWYRQAQGRPHNLHAWRWDHLARRVGFTPASFLCAFAPLRENPLTSSLQPSA